MKRIIPIALILLLFFGCQAKYARPLSPAGLSGDEKRALSDFVNEKNGKLPGGGYRLKARLDFDKQARSIEGDEEKLTLTVIVENLGRAVEGGVVQLFGHRIVKTGYDSALFAETGFQLQPGETKELPIELRRAGNDLKGKYIFDVESMNASMEAAVKLMPIKTEFQPLVVELGE